MEFEIDRKLKNKIDLRNLYKKEGSYHTAAIALIIVKISIALVLIINPIFSWLMYKLDDNNFLKLIMGKSYLKQYIISVISREIFIGVFCFGGVFLIQLIIGYLALNSEDVKKQERMSVIDNKLIYSYEKLSINPTPQRAFLAIDLSSIYTIDYDEKKREIVIEGCMEEKVLDYNTRDEEIEFNGMNNNIISLYDYYTPSLYEYLNQHRYN
ncbi:hypothetical protein [Lachnospira multipara]|uniref:hypothetical protein n=1 Tax=Lachnospira multipara TaxID=28051 RepID=UPI00047F596B|nr:hypothetical protein [Lachnospira multipara]